MNYKYRIRNIEPFFKLAREFHEVFKLKLRKTEDAVIANMHPDHVELFLPGDNNDDYSGLKDRTIQCGVNWLMYGTADRLRAEEQGKLILQTVCMLGNDTDEFWPIGWPTWRITSVTRFTRFVWQYVNYRFFAQNYRPQRRLYK